MDKRTDNAIRRYVSEVSKQTSGIATAYLFGSYAKNKQREDSDIDIAFVFNELNDTEKFDWQVRLLLLASKYDSRIEPHPIALYDIDSGNPFAREIKQTGILIDL
jgi:predicted nucleotidyltransferase